MFMYFEVSGYFSSEQCLYLIIVQFVSSVQIRNVGTNDGHRFEASF